MADLSSIPTAVAMIKNGIEIVNAIRDADISLDKAEMKLQLAELKSLLFDAKNEVFEVSEQIRVRDMEIQDLKQRLSFKETVRRVNDGYFELDSDSEPVGDPYCLKCFESEARGIHLVVRRNGRERECPVCQTTYHSYRVALPNKDMETYEAE